LPKRGKIRERDDGGDLTDGVLLNDGRDGRVQEQRAEENKRDQTESDTSDDVLEPLGERIKRSLLFHFVDILGVIQIALRHVQLVRDILHSDPLIHLENCCRDCPIQQDAEIEGEGSDTREEVPNLFHERARSGEADVRFVLGKAVRDLAAAEEAVHHLEEEEGRREGQRAAEPEWRIAVIGVVEVGLTVEPNEEDDRVGEGAKHSQSVLHGKISSEVDDAIENDHEEEQEDADCQGTWKEAA